jgi:hypothetical protein
MYQRRSSLRHRYISTPSRFHTSFPIHSFSCFQKADTQKLWVLISPGCNPNSSRSIAFIKINLHTIHVGACSSSCLPPLLYRSRRMLKNGGRRAHGHTWSCLLEIWPAADHECFAINSSLHPLISLSRVFLFPSTVKKACWGRFMVSTPNTGF